MSSWTSTARARARRDAETVLFAKKGDGDVRVCLAYPNRYPVAMGNLGFQVVYEIIDREPGVVCERAFLPDEEDRFETGRLCCLESGRAVAESEVLAFSVSFETDYWHVVRMLDSSGLPPRRRDRGPGAPLVIAGGPATFLNPEPLADFVDLFLIGEAEEMLPEFFAVYRECLAAGADRPALLARLAERVAGVYVPEFFTPRFDDGVQTAIDHTGPGPEKVERRLVWDLNRFATTSRVLSDEAVFGDMVLVEASRGCQWGCRFCAAGYMYRPIRTRGTEELARSVLEALEHRKTIGLVGAEMASVPGVEALSELANEGGGRLSPSSLKADCVTPRLAAALGKVRNRSVTIAPEAGSERMRRVINKNLTEADILRAADLLIGEGVPDLKLYFMIGLPTETDEDVLAIAELTAKLAQRVARGGRNPRRVGAVTTSINPFVPKPWTPFQWDPMEEIPAVKAKAARLRAALRRLPNVKVDIESPREAYFQTVLSRGDRRVGAFLEAIHAAAGDWWAVLQRWRREGLPGAPHPDSYVHRRYGDDEVLPWDFIDHRIAKSYLWLERRKALAARQTAPCDTTTCTSCAAC